MSSALSIGIAIPSATTVPLAQCGRIIWLSSMSSTLSIGTTIPSATTVPLAQCGRIIRAGIWLSSMSSTLPKGIAMSRATTVPLAECGRIITAGIARTMSHGMVTRRHVVTDSWQCQPPICPSLSVDAPLRNCTLCCSDVIASTQIAY